MHVYFFQQAVNFKDFFVKQVNSQIWHLYLVRGALISACIGFESHDITMYTYIGRYGFENGTNNLAMYLT